MASLEVSPSDQLADNDDFATPIPAPYSAARAVFHISDLRLAILALLDRKTLVSCMRLEKGAIEDVASLLYREIPYEIAQTDLSSDPVRRASYCNAVREIDGVFTGKITPGLQKHFNNLLSTVDRALIGQNGGRGFMSHYQPAVYNLIIPPFRREFPGLRKVRFGMGRVAPPCWTAYFGPDRADVTATADSNSGSPSTIHAGSKAHIEVLQDYDYVLADSLPETLPLKASPADNITIRHLVNFSFVPARDNEGHTILGPRIEDLLPRWKHAIEHSPLFDFIHVDVKSDDFQTPLDLFTSLYERQISLGRCPAERIAYIRVYLATPWSIDDFQRFATVASASLTSLLIGSRCHHYDDDCESLISFSDLHSITAIVQQYLPHLTNLHINMRGIAEAESACRKMLYPGILEERGTVVNLTITSNHFNTTLFNSIRAVSTICAPDAKVFINGPTKAGWRREDQTYLLNALRSESPERRPQLAVVNFPSVGMEYPCQLPDLRYHDDGRPWPTTFSALKLLYEPRPDEGMADHQ